MTSCMNCERLKSEIAILEANIAALTAEKQRISDEWFELRTQLESRTAERDLYKPYYDAVIDMAVIDWTLDGLSKKDAHHAIQRIIAQHAQEACDPAVNEELAKLTAERDELKRRLDAIVAMLEPGEKPTEYQYAFDLYPKSNFEKALEKWKALQSLHVHAKAISEGREP